MRHFSGGRALRLALVLVSVCAVALFAGCGNTSDQTAVKSEFNAGTSAKPNGKDNGKPLVIYFARGANTAPASEVDAITGPSLKADGNGFRSDEQVLAEWIAEETKGNLFAIQTVKKYPAGYDDVVEEGKQEKMEDARPKLSSRLQNLDDYQTVYFVYPNWWGDLPMPVYSFFDEYDFSGKKIITVVISGGGGFAGTISTIQRLEPGADVVEGIDIYKKDMEDAQEKIVSWLRE